MVRRSVWRIGVKTASGDSDILASVECYKWKMKLKVDAVVIEHLYFLE
jgi:hypothetical protein